MALKPRWTLAPKGTNPGDLDEFEYCMDAMSPEGEFNWSNSAATIIYYVGWDSIDGDGTDNLKNFLSDVLGYAYPSMLSSGVLNRILPEPHPHFPFLYAADAKYVGRGIPDHDDKEGPTKTVAVVTVSFRPTDYEVIPDNQRDTELDRFVTRKFSVNGQYLTIQGAMKFVSGGNFTTDLPSKTVMPTQPGKIVAQMDMEYTWRNVPARAGTAAWIPPNNKKVLACEGRLNRVTFDPTVLAAPPGTVLFEAIESRMILPTIGGSEAAAFTVNGGQRYYDLVLKFKYMNNGLYQGPVADLASTYCGLNFVFRTFRGTCPNDVDAFLPFWDLVSSDGTLTGANIYTEEPDLNDLFAIFP